MSESSLVPVLLERLAREFAAHRDPERAREMAAYMRDQFPFVGIPAPQRSALFSRVMRDLPPPDAASLAALALACWERPEREYQYFAAQYLRKHVRRCSADFLATVEVLLTTQSWWDTVDELAQHVVGPLVAAHPELQAAMDRWIESENFWLARTALLHQNRYRGKTDAGRLFAYCLRRSGDAEFFIRKAIGWALREYSKTDPAAVRRFVADHEHELSPLSQREALKRLGR